MKKSLPVSKASRLPRNVLTVATVLLGLCSSTGALAQVQRSIINPSFEQPNLTTGGCRVYINSSQVPGWVTTHTNNSTENTGGCLVNGSTGTTNLGASPGPIIEMWRTPRNNGSGGTVDAPQGLQIAELNAVVASRLYQNVCLVRGESFRWRFSHRGRVGNAADTGTYDQAEFVLGTSTNIVKVATSNAGTFLAPVVGAGASGVVATPVSGNTTWINYSGSYLYGGATGNTSLGFEAIGGTTSGNLLDDIQIELAPFVEFVQSSSSTPESGSNNRPTLRVNGTVYAGFTVTVNITGGTATLGTDYTTPGNGTTLTVNVPAGTYDGTNATGSLFPLPVSVVNDGVVEPNETILFQIQAPPAVNPPFLLASSATCGGTARGTWEYTIIDDDGVLAISKSASAPVPVAGSLTQYDITYTIEVTEIGNGDKEYSSLVDTPSFDADVTNISLRSLTRTTTGTSGTTGGALAATPINTAGPWNLITNTRTLTASGNSTDTYTLVVRFSIAPGSAGSDTCAGSGTGLYNSVTATRVAAGNPTHTSNACRTTPTPVWATLRKQLQGRNAVADQFQVRLFSGGIQSASATTSGSATPSTASTGQQVLPAGSTLQFEEALKANGTGADQVPGSYTTLLSCSNATAGSTTVLPGGTGTGLANRQQWPEFTPAAGDVLDCVITNTPGGANLSITKTNTPGSNGDIDQASDTVIQGATTTYTLVVRNSGPAAANGAVVRDTPAAGLVCGTATCAAAGASQCPAATAAALASALQSGAGVAIPLLPAGAANAVTFTLTCQVQ